MIGVSLSIYLSMPNVRQDSVVTLFDENCSVCHGENLEGTALGTPLKGVDLIHGDSIADISKSIAEGFLLTGMPGWSQTLDEGQVRSLAGEPMGARLDVF